MRGLSVAEQRYQAVLAVIADGLTVRQVAEKTGVSRQTLHSWLARYEAEGLEGVSDRSRRPRSGPHQMGAEVEAVVLELRRGHRYWGARRMRHELTRRRVGAAAGMPSESAIYRRLVRAGLVAPLPRHRRAERFERWERAAPMQLWQMDVVGGFLLADGTHAKALTGIDDHSRFCISARLMTAERTRAVCDGLAAALRSYGCPSQLLTDTGRSSPASTTTRRSRCSSTGSAETTASSTSSPRRAHRRPPARSSASTRRCAASLTPAGCSPRSRPRSRPSMSGSPST